MKVEFENNRLAKSTCALSSRSTKPSYWIERKNGTDKLPGHLFKLTLYFAPAIALRSEKQKQRLYFPSSTYPFYLSVYQTTSKCIQFCWFYFYSSLLPHLSIYISLSLSLHIFFELCKLKGGEQVKLSYRRRCHRRCSFSSFVSNSFCFRHFVTQISTLGQ